MNFEKTGKIWEAERATVSGWDAMATARAAVSMEAAERAQRRRLREYLLDMVRDLDEGADYPNLQSGLRNCVEATLDEAWAMRIRADVDAQEAGRKLLEEARAAETAPNAEEPAG